MKITKSQLKQIIKEEISKVLSEDEDEEFRKKQTEPKEKVEYELYTRHAERLKKEGRDYDKLAPYQKSHVWSALMHLIKFGSGEYGNKVAYDDNYDDFKAAWDAGLDDAEREKRHYDAAERADSEI